MDWKGKKVFISGAGGFVGSHLTEELYNKGAEVTALVHYNSRNDWGNLELLSPRIKSRIRIVVGDVRDPFFMRRAMKGQEIVFHLSSLIAIPFSYIAPHEYFQTNCLGCLNVMEACKEKGVEKVIHTSTSEVYGTAQYTPMDEKHPLQAQSPYSASKIAADKIVESYYDSFDLPVTTLRPFNTYGGRQSARAVIPTIITQMLTQEYIKLGSLKPVRDFTYIDDTIQAFIDVAESHKTNGQVLNCGSGSGHSIKDIVDMISVLMEKDYKLECDGQRIRPEKSEVMKLICNNSKIFQYSGWIPRTDIKVGLMKTIKYMKENIQRYKPEIYNV